MDEQRIFPVIRFFNTLTRKEEVFRTLEQGVVKLYCCGPTVYNYQHIGNLRTYVFEDILVRVLRYAGYQVRHVMNITDVGHLVSDADEGEDKMLVAAKREKKSSHEIAGFYTDVFFEHCRELNIVRPTVVCKATEHVSQMVELVRRLEEKGFAYLSGGNVYFDVSKFVDYGRLALLSLDSLKGGARIEVDERKRNVHDFALWFTASKFENQELQWDSPWGRGYPGWHIECSAMSMAYLGEQFDIHCGGIDHIPVHHTNEIAQSEAASGKQLATFWLHGGFLVADKAKMSKSAGGFLTLDVLKERGYDPLAYRLFCLGGSYRQELSWSWEALEAAANSLKKLRSSVASWQRQAAERPEASLELRRAGYSSYLTEFERAIYSDLALPRAVAVFHAMSSDSALTPMEKLDLARRLDQVLGLGIESWENTVEEVPSVILDLARQREEARSAKNWREADRLREEISARGYAVEDAREGTKVRKT